MYKEQREASVKLKVEWQISLSGFTGVSISRVWHLYVIDCVHLMLEASDPIHTYT